MKMKVFYFIPYFLLTILVFTLPTFAQVDSLSKVVNSEFPNSWDVNRELRQRNGQVLLWKHIKRGNHFEGKYCIALVLGPDSSGQTKYFISKMYSNKKPFVEWNYGYTHYQDYFVDSATGMTFGFRDLHLKKYDHKPTEDEMYSLFKKWNFAFFDQNSKTMEAGMDERLWLEVFEFIPDKKRLLRIE